MRKFFFGFMIGLAIGAAGSAIAAITAQTIAFMSSNGLNIIPVSAANPLPIYTDGQASGVVSPTAGTAYVIATGGTAVTIVTGPIKGGYIQNPLSATDQGISTAEVVYINPVGTAGTTGNNTTTALQPGQSYNLPPSSKNVSANAATSGHELNVVVW